MASRCPFDSSGYAIAEAIRSVPQSAAITLIRHTVNHGETVCKLTAATAADQFWQWRQMGVSGCRYYIQVKVRCCTPLDLENLMILKFEEFKNREFVKVDVLDRHGSIQKVLARQREEADGEAMIGHLAIHAAINGVVEDSNNERSNERSNQRLGDVQGRRARAAVERVEWEHVEDVQSAGQAGRKRRNDQVTNVVSGSIDWDVSRKSRA